MDIPLQLQLAPLIEQQTILVVGMHRSGTSLAARMINLMGATVGPAEKLLPAHPYYNPTGYWEHTGIIDEHERYLQAHGCGWTTIANFSTNKYLPERRHALIAALRSIVAAIACDGKPLVVKDPRLCLLLDVWAGVVSRPIHVVVVRDPRKTAASLMAKYPHQFTTDYLLALWQKYMQIAIGALCGELVLFVSYARLVTNVGAEHHRLWQGLVEMGVPSLRQLADHELQDLVDDRLDRSEPTSHAHLSTAQADLVAWLNEQTQSKGAVTVTARVAISEPNAVLSELETLRQTYVKHGMEVAKQRKTTNWSLSATSAAHRGKC